MQLSGGKITESLLRTTLTTLNGDGASGARVRGVHTVRTSRPTCRFFTPSSEKFWKDHPGSFTEFQPSSLG